MKSFKSILSTILVIILLLSTFCITTSINAAKTSGICCDNLLWSFDSSTGTLTISGKGALYEGDDEWNDFKKDIRKLIIGLGITRIGDRIFFGYTSLYEVEIPDTLTDIGISAFYNTPFYDTLSYNNYQHSLGNRLLRVEDVPEHITINQEIKYICDGAFSDNQNITDITISDGVIYIGNRSFEYLFIKNIIIPDNVKGIGSEAFQFSPFLETVSISEGVTEIKRGTFRDCYSLKSVVIPQSIINIEDYAFYSCSKLESIFIPNSVKNIGTDVFDYCPKLTIKCYENSYAHQYSIENGIPYQLLNSSVTEKGMQFKIENLESVKSIRYAYGEYDSEKDIKYGVDSVSHSAKTLRKRGENCTLQFTKPGLVSIVITYNDGTRDFYKYEVIKSEPTVIRDGNSITFGNLTDLKVLRYAKGEYESSSEIKRAENSVAVSGKTLDSDTYTVTLEPGTYTFCVQYNDESYNYYTFDIKG